MKQQIQANIDTQKVKYSPIGSTNSGDNTVLELDITINSVPLEYVNPTFELLVKKTDGNRARQINGIVLENNKVIIDLETQAINFPGIATCQLVIKDNGRISTCLFYIVIGTSLDRDILQSSSKIEVLEQLDEYVALGFANLDEYEKRLVAGEGFLNVAGAEEVKRVNNETSRKESEGIRKENELDREYKENIRKNAESIREEKELERETSELDRKNSETNRTESENERKAKETARQEEENTRINNENLRVQDEQTRQQKENERLGNENTRSTSETLRKQEEDIRKNSEQARVIAETNRATKETERVVSENTRVAKFEEIKKDYETYKNVMIAQSNVANLQSQINQTNSSLEDKAKQSDLEIERERINNLTRLDEGSTTGDAELIDGRVGADGTVYQNIGNAIRKPVDEINNALFDNKQEILTNLLFEDGSQHVDGTFSNDANYSHIDIQVKENEVYYVTGWNYYLNVLYAILDKDGIVLKQVQNSGASESKLFNDEIVMIPNGGVILRVNKIKPKADANFIPIIKKNVKIAKFEKQNISTNERIDNILDDTALVKNNVKNLLDDNEVKLILVANDFKQGKIDLQGENEDSEQACRLERFLISKQCTSFIIPNNYIGYITYYDRDKKFIKRDYMATITKPDERQGDFFRVFIQKSDYSSFNVNEEIVEGTNIMLNNRYNTVFFPNKSGEKPLDVIDKTGGYFSIFHDFGVIGDSLSVGNMEGIDTTTGSYIYKDNFDYSWGKSIERATGCTYHRFGRGGQYLHDNNWFDEWKDKITNDLCQCYIICIGFNDYNWLKENPTRYGSIDDIKADYTQNPNTFYGQYSKMIQLIKSLQPQARLFLCNMEWNNTDDSNINIAISDICSHFENCYLIDLNIYAHEPSWRTPNQFKTGLYHKNTLGYQKMAWIITSYIDYIIRHNMREFADVQFIGTTYRLPTNEEIEVEKNK